MVESCIVLDGMSVTKSILYDTKDVLYDTKPVLYDTKSLLYDTKPILYVTNDVLYATNAFCKESPLENRLKTGIFDQQRVGRAVFDLKPHGSRQRREPAESARNWPCVNYLLRNCITIITGIQINGENILRISPTSAILSILPPYFRP